MNGVTNGNRCNLAVALVFESPSSLLLVEKNQISCRGVEVKAAATIFNGTTGSAAI